MKKILIINTHSMVDVITNSSTELFVCDTDKTVEMVKEILAADPNVYGYEEPWVFHVDEYRKWKKEKREAEKRNKEYWDIHKKSSGEMDKFWESGFSQIDGWFYDIEDPEDLEYLRKHYIKEGDNSGGWWSSDRNPFHRRLCEAEEKVVKITKANVGDDKLWKVRHLAKQEEIQKIYDETAALKNKPEWWANPIKFHYNDQPVGDLDGKIIIIGTEDNSIPYDHFDWIEHVFNATRHHLG